MGKQAKRAEATLTTMGWLVQNLYGEIEKIWENKPEEKGRFVIEFNQDLQLGGWWSEVTGHEMPPVFASGSTLGKCWVATMQKLGVQTDEDFALTKAFSALVSEDVAICRESADLEIQLRLETVEGTGESQACFMLLFEGGKSGYGKYTSILEGDSLDTSLANLFRAISNDFGFITPALPQMLSCRLSAEGARWLRGLDLKKS